MKNCLGVRISSRLERAIGPSVLSLLLILAGCAAPLAPTAAPTLPTATQPAAPTAAPTATLAPPTALSPSVVVPSPVSTATAVPAGSVDWVATVQSGDIFVVLFDETRDKFDDSRYTGDWRTDPLGTLRGTYAYRVRFSPVDGWVTSGYNQAAGEIITAVYPAGCALPAERQLCLWGAEFTSDEWGQVFDPTYGLVGHLHTAAQPSAPPAPVVSLTAEIETALWDYVRVRKEAEETLNPALLAEVCVDPYLTWKTERIQENIRDGSHWATPSAHFTVTSFIQPTMDTAVVRVSKLETKLFYPRGSAIPDDEICGDAIYSYRDCHYEIEYQMVRSRDRWYVSDARSLGDCPGQCRKGTPAAAVEPLGWPALPANLYFLRDGRLWRWPASGGELEELPLAGELVSLQDYSLSPEGRYVAYQSGSDGSLYVLDRPAGRLAFPPAGAAAEGTHGYRFLKGDRLLVVADSGALSIVDLVQAVVLFPLPGAEPVYVRTFADDGKGGVVVQALPGFTAECRLAPDGRFLAYATPAGELFVLDMSSFAVTPVPTAGTLGQFDLTSDGRYAVYLAEGYPPDAEAIAADPNRQGRPYATVMAVDLQDLGQAHELGLCGSRGGYYESLVADCLGFALSPDGRQVVYVEGRGTWVAQVPEGEPRLLDAYPEDNQSWFCMVYRLYGWTAGGEAVLEYSVCYEGGGTVVLDVRTGQGYGLGWCYIDCAAEVVDGPAGEWASVVPDWGLSLSRFSPDGGFESIQVITAGAGLWPARLVALDDGRVGFLHQRCARAGDESVPPAGVFIAAPDGTWRRVATLPSPPCPEGYLEFWDELGLGLTGQVLWEADGAAFLYSDAAGAPVLLGWTDGSALWDVRQVLAGATAFQWGR